MNHSHCSDLVIETPPGAKKIVLAGNPNTGKSVFFNRFTGIYVEVSNYPGTTLDISYGRLGNDIVIDTPGVYGISSFNDEERVARDIILSADVVVNVVSAVHLERDLFLTQQIIDAEIPLIVALNMSDETNKLGIKVDVELLSNLLGVPVIPTVAVKNRGIEEVKRNIGLARVGVPTPGVKEMIGTLIDKVDIPGEALLILEGDPVVAARHGSKPGKAQEEIYLNRRERVNEVVNRVVRETSQEGDFGAELGRLMIKPLTGVPILLFALWVIYKVIGVFVAGTVVGLTEDSLMKGLYEPLVCQAIKMVMPLESIPGQILAGDFGLLTMTPTYLFGLLMPLVAGFYFFLALFEDSGYLPRIATLTDRLLSSIGLNGRGVIPLILGFGCVTMATITTRLLSTDRERIIAIFLLGLTIPCSAQLGVITGMLTALGVQFLIVYVFVITAVLVITGTLLSTLLPGTSTDLLIDLPPLRIPRPDNILKKTFTRTYGFLKEAFPLFALGALLISLLEITGILLRLQHMMAPLVVTWLGLPKSAATAFIMGIVRRDFGAAGLADMALTPEQTVVALITITLFVPCIASVMVIFKERTKKEAVLMWMGSWIIAFLTGGVVSQILKVFGGISFCGPVIPIFVSFGAATLIVIGLSYLVKRLGISMQG